jgi:hypothetical protein
MATPRKPKEQLDYTRRPFNESLPIVNMGKPRALSSKPELPEFEPNPEDLEFH